MKEWLKKISVSLLLAGAELVLGLLLLIKPVEFTSIVIAVIGALLAVLGGFHLYRYIRLSREEAAKTWKLASGAGLLIIGICAIASQRWLVALLSTLTTLYGGLALAGSFMKLQIAVDALRGKRPFWYLMAVSFVVSVVLATLLFLQVFNEGSVWVITGIVLLVTAVLDGVYFFLGRQKKSPAVQKAE